MQDNHDTYALRKGQGAKQRRDDKKHKNKQKSNNRNHNHKNKNKNKNQNAMTDDTAPIKKQ